MAKCDKCRRGPTDIAGHADLFAYRLGSKTLEFTCRGCEAKWTRSTGQAGDFTWATSSERFGVALPQG